jgi:hypothetical protein
MEILRLALLFLFVVVSSSASATEISSLPLFSAEYTVHADGLKVGEMKRALKAMGNETFMLETRAYTTGVVAIFKKDEYTERSIWRVTKEGYVPVEFFSRYTGRSKDVVERLRFDWARKVFMSLRDGKEKEVGLEPGVLDKLMWQVVMRDDLANGHRILKYRVADRGKIDEYSLEVIGEETIKTNLGKQRTVKVKKGTTVLWCAVDLDYLPVKLEQQDDGHTIASYITTLKREPLAKLALAKPRAPAKDLPSANVPKTAKPTLESPSAKP